VDYIVTHFPDFVEKYHSEGARAFLVQPMPYNPAKLRKLPDVEKKYDATFVGSLYPYRRDYIAEIARSGADVAYLGGGNEQKLTHSSMVRIFNESRINVNLGSGRPGRTALVGRLFEVALCGGFLLTEYIPGVEHNFEIGKEIDCFSSPAEAADKIKFYLANPDVREKIAARGYERAQADYSARHLLERLFNSIEHDLSENGRPVPGSTKQDTRPLHEFEADEYYKWVKALLEQQRPLRDEWLETARLVLATNPSHRGARRLLKRAERFGDPRPIRRLVSSAETRAAVGVNSGIARFRRTRIGGFLAAVRRKLRQAA
jgi:hypothetical protein